jgi:hypothetical protein
VLFLNDNRVLIYLSGSAIAKRVVRKGRCDVSLPVVRPRAPVGASMRRSLLVNFSECDVRVDTISSDDSSDTNSASTATYDRKSR